MHIQSQGLTSAALQYYLYFPRYNATLSVIMVFVSNLVLAFNLFVMVATRYLRYDIRDSIGKLLQQAATEDT